MASDKKDYIDTIEALTILSTIKPIRNKLNKIRARTEDQRLIRLLDAAIFRLDTSSSRATDTLDLKKSEYGTLKTYCRSILESAKPHWQILAERNDWAPKS